MIASCPFHAPSKDLFSTKFSKTRCIYVSSPHSDEARMLLMGRDFSPSYFHTRSLLLALTGMYYVSSWSKETCGVECSVFSFVL